MSRIMLFGSLFFTLAACGGSSDPELRSGENSNEILQENVVQLLDRYENEAFTDLNELPRSGGANYQGFVGLVLREELSGDSGRLLAQISLDVDFDDAQSFLNGQIHDVEESDGTEVRGSLAISEGELDRSVDTSIDASLTASIDGTIRFADGSAPVLVLKLEGDFRGNQADAVGGNILGEYLLGETVGSVDGTFIAEKRDFK